MTRKTILQTILVASCCGAIVVDGFAPPSSSSSFALTRLAVVPSSSSSSLLRMSDGSTPTSEQEAEEQRRIGNLVADEEWNGLSMELAEIIRTAVVEDMKKNSRDFLGKDEYLLGDFSKEIDNRVKAEVARIREKDSYEVGCCCCC
jgi:hypothetical protein